MSDTLLFKVPSKIHARMENTYYQNIGSFLNKIENDMTTNQEPFESGVDHLIGLSKLIRILSQFLECRDEHFIVLVGLSF